MTARPARRLGGTILEQDGRLPEITVSGDRVTVRLRVAGGPPPALLELAAALDGVFSGSRATGFDPSSR